MHIKLPEQLEAYLQSMVTSGLYSSTSELIRELIRKDMEVKQNQHNAAFYNAVRAGDESASLGNVVPYTHDLIHNIKRQAIENITNDIPTTSSEALPK
ncbi:MAG: putative addiction module CopG family antidote [Alphaproteobacteria bacterium]|jgi:putative addiction module CopG family antidote